MAGDRVGGRTEKQATASADSEEIVAHCTSCRCERIFVRARVRHLRHFMSTLLTGGLWLIAWLAVSIARSIRPWRCENCGWHKPEFRGHLREAIQLGEAALLESRGR